MQRGLPTNPSPIKGASSDRVGILAVTRAAETCDRCDNPCIARRLSFRGFREYRWGEGRAERFSGIAAELVRLNVDVILAGGTEAAVAAKHATSVIPIVFPSAGDRSAAAWSHRSRDQAATSPACQTWEAISPPSASDCCARFSRGSGGWESWPMPPIPAV